MRIKLNRMVIIEINRAVYISFFLIIFCGFSQVYSQSKKEDKTIYDEKTPLLRDLRIKPEKRFSMDQAVVSPDFLNGISLEPEGKVFRVSASGSLPSIFDRFVNPDYKEVNFNMGNLELNPLNKKPVGSSSAVFVPGMGTIFIPTGGTLVVPSGRDLSFSKKGVLSRKVKGIIKAYR